MHDKDEQQSFIARRVDAFTGRSREPGDADTWAVVLGSLMCALLMICFSVGRNTNLIWIPIVIFVAWFAVVSRFGRVNVTSILWGSSTSDAGHPVYSFFIMHPTAVVALISLITVAIDAFGDRGFGWFGVGLVLVCAVYVFIYLRHFPKP